MTHSLFSDVIRIVCTLDDPQEYAKLLSSKTPGNYTLAFSLQCNNSYHITKRIKDHLSAQEYVKEFYQVSTKVAERMLKREALIIPAVNIV